MKNILNVLKQVLKDFFINPFWRNWGVLAFVFLSVLGNLFLWYIYISKIKANPNPFILLSGLAVLNICLGNYLFNKEKLAAFFLLVITLTMEIFMLAFAKYLMVIS